MSTISEYSLDDPEERKRELFSTTRDLYYMARSSISEFDPDRTEEYLKGTIPFPDIDLELALDQHQDPTIADMTIVAGVVHGDDKQRGWIHEQVDPDILPRFSVFGELYEAIYKNSDLEYEDLLIVLDKIASNRINISTKLPFEGLSKDYIFFLWRETLRLRPTRDQISKAIDIRIEYCDDDD